MVFDWKLAYVAGVALCGVTLSMLLRWYFTRAEGERKESVEALRRFVAVSTEKNEVDWSPRGRERAVESIETRFAMLRRLLIPVVLLITVLVMLAPFLTSAPATLVSLLVAAATVIIGFAAKPVIENSIAGVMLSFSQPIRIGDIVRVSGNFGIVENIFLTYTVIKTWDWRRYVIPNHRLMQIEYENFSLHDKWQWAYVSFWVEHGCDLDRVEELAKEAVKASPHHLEDEPIGFWIVEVGKEGVQCWIAGWAEHPFLAWSLRHDVAKRLMRLLQEHAIRAHVYNIENREARSAKGGEAQQPTRGNAANTE